MSSSTSTTNLLEEGAVTLTLLSDNLPRCVGTADDRFAAALHRIDGSLLFLGIDLERRMVLGGLTKSVTSAALFAVLFNLDLFLPHDWVLTSTLALDRLVAELDQRFEDILDLDRSLLQDFDRLGLCLSSADADKAGAWIFCLQIECERARVSALSR